MDYPLNEQLTRSLAIDRMKQLSVLIAEAKEINNMTARHLYEAERLKLKLKYLKVVQ